MPTINTASLNGATMIWISGRSNFFIYLKLNLTQIYYIQKNTGFADNMFTFSPTSTTSNEVYLTDQFSSYSCEIHSDKVTTTQITCYTP